MTIIYTLAELKAKRDRLNAEINSYNDEKIWLDCFDKMSIHNLIFERNSDNLLIIKLPLDYNIYSWELPKGSFTIASDHEHFIITVYDKPLRTSREDFRD